MRIADAMVATPSLTIAILEASHASQYLGNNQRTGFTDTAVPAKPALLWTYKERHAPKTAWPEPFGELQFIDFDYSDQVTIGRYPAEVDFTSAD